MARNRTPEYINRIRKLEAPNGFKFDIANYLYNPSYEHEYPNFTKVIATEGELETVKNIYYFKHYDGSGEYIAQTFQRKKNVNGWQIVSHVKEETIERSNRFNVQKLLSFCTD